MEVSPNQILDYLNFKGPKVLDEDVQNKLREIVRCAVCYEVPTGKDLKVLTCGQGHHFCASCYKNLKHCAICRGQFFSGRNFVVEKLITQLGPSLGLTEHNPPPPDETPNLVPGKYPCLHGCSNQFKAGQMLSHLRKYHNQNLLDNARSNPYLKRFDGMFTITYSMQNINVFSVQISDMGLFTVIINITDDCLIGSLHFLSGNAISSLYQYRLTVKINKTGCSHEFSISNCDLHSYSYDTNAIVSSEKYLKLETSKLSELINMMDQFQIIFSIWRKTEEKEESNIRIVVPGDPVLFNNDRNKRRNRQRNVRRNRLKLKFKEIENFDGELSNYLQKLNLTHI